MMMGFISSILAACAGERPGNLGLQSGLMIECPRSPNCVSSQARDEVHRISPLVFSDDPAQAFARLKQVLGHRRDTTLIKDRPGFLLVEFHTTFFVDDGLFLLDEERQLIQVRSASRLGYSDLGKNRRRLEDIRQQFDHYPTR
jgi:uncharacterized protein (DUF1499 family)